MIQFGLETLSNMYGFPWSSAIKKRVLRYLLQRYVGQFLKEKLSLEQLTVDISDGTGTIKELLLDIDALNEVGSQLNLPFRFVEGYIGGICVNIPWNALLAENCFVEISGLALTLQPKQRVDNVSVVDSMLESMTSSMKLAKECLSNEDECESEHSSDSNRNSRDSSDSVNGIEHFAQAIDTILNKIKVKFVDTVLRVELCSNKGISGLALELHLMKVHYFDEAGGLQQDDLNKPDNGATYFETTSFTSKKFQVEGLSLYTEEFNNMDNLHLDLNVESDSEHRMGMGELSVDLDENIILESSSSHSKLLFARILGKQEIRLSLKQNELAYGPKVNVEMSCGACIMFLSPRQIGLLSELIQGITSPVSSDIKSENPPSQIYSHQKPMNSDDFKKIEKDLMTLIKPSSNSLVGLDQNTGWSSPHNVDIDDEFLPLRYKTTSDVQQNMGSSVSSVYSEMDESQTSVLSDVHIKLNDRVFRKDSYLDKVHSNTSNNVEIITSFTMRLSCLACIILHEDILVLDKDHILTDVSLEKLRAESESFFSNVGLLNISGQHSNFDFIEVQKKLSNLCKLSHLSILGGPVNAEGNETSTSSKWEMETKVSFGCLEVIECIMEKSEVPEFCDLFKFNGSNSNESKKLYVPSVKPKIEISIIQTQRMKYSGRILRKGIPKFEIEIQLDRCQMEIDVSIIDRLSSLLNMSKIISTDNSKPSFDCFQNPESLPYLLDESSSKSEVKLNLVIVSPLLSLKLRFPIPDLRPISDMNRIPWWKRNLREDLIIADFKDIYFGTSIDPFEKRSCYEVRSSDIHVFYKPPNSLSLISIVNITSRPGQEDGFDLARIMVYTYPVAHWVDFEECRAQNVVTKSMVGFLDGLDKREASPFTKRKRASQMHGHFSEDIKKPAGKEEINMFIEETLKNVGCHLDIYLPNIEVILPSKYITELLYNRLVSDLLLWVPSAPRNENDSTPTCSTFLDGFDGIRQHFSNLSSDLDCDVDYDTSQYYSVYDLKSRQQAQQLTSEESIEQTFMGVNVTIGSLKGLLKTPYRDENFDIFNQYNGEIVITAEQGTVFSAVGYKGNMDQGYTCILANKFCLYHKAKKDRSHSLHLNKMIPISTSDLDAIVYPSDKIVKMGRGSIESNKSQGSLTLSFKIDFDSFKNKKSIVFAGGLDGLTVRHRVAPSHKCWHTQIADLFSLDDYPIAGYVLPDVITELNVHFWNCAMDYRPENLPLRLLLTLDSLSIISNLSLNSNTSVLHFLIEDAGIFLSNSKKFENRNLRIREDYTCVTHLGVFEITLKNIDANNLNGAQQELVVSNNVIHLRTCADSCKALMEMMIYLANDGDLVLPAMCEESCKNIVLESTHVEVNPSPKSNLNEQKIFASLLKDAMTESFPVDDFCSQNIDTDEVNVFFFPDEHANITKTQPRHLQKKSSESSSSRNASIDSDTVSALCDALEEDSSPDSNFEEANSGTDEEFCILEDIPGIGIRSPSGEPRIRTLINDSICIFDNHFEIPNVKFDQLKAPSNFPEHVFKYVLQELTLVWHIYDGNDLKNSKVSCRNSDDRNGNHTGLNEDTDITESTVIYNVRDPMVRFAPETYSSRDFMNQRPSSIPINHNDSYMQQRLLNSNEKWFVVGGPNRCRSTSMELQLTKVQFSYELYPDTAKEVSRLVLLINDIEIRDRLLSSKINKFLYQFSSEDYPRQSHSNMFQFKMLTTRNEPGSTVHESKMKISLLPIRLNVDQDALLFLIRFFQNIFDGEKNTENVFEEFPAAQTQMPATSLTHRDKVISNPQLQPEVGGDEVLPIYFKNFIFSPEVPIKIDYHGKYVDINSQYGAFAGLIIGLGQLNQSQITLKRLEYKMGMLGIDRLISSVFNDWINDIRVNQLPSILGGLGPIHSFVKLFGGLKDLIYMPIEQYQKDGRVFRGLQRGTTAFTTSTAHAALDLSGRFVGCIQSMAETMYDVVSSGPSVSTRTRKGNVGGQPKDIREGVTSAYGLVRNGLEDTANNIWRVASEEHSLKGVSGALGGVLRQVPSAVVQPIILASEATQTLIGGVTNQIVPDARKEAAEKWKI